MLQRPPHWKNKFPLLAVENNCILSKDADITACFEVRFTGTVHGSFWEYEAIHSAWHKAIKTLPDFTVIHKQDWYIKENYAPDLAIEDQSFYRSPTNAILTSDRFKSLLLPVLNEDHQRGDAYAKQLQFTLQRFADTKGNQEQGNDTPLYGSGGTV